MRIDELVLQTRDLAGLRDFYSGTLGLPTLPSADDMLSLQAGRSRLIFQQADADWRGYYHFAFDVPENQLPEAKAGLAGRAALIRDGSGRDAFHSDSWNSDSVYFYDPAGNILEFIARHNQRNRAADLFFSAASIIAVTEIGLTCADVPAQVERLQAELGVAVYADGASEEFAPVGDEEGLLIVVKQGRVWFPDTGKPAVLAPLALTLTTPASGTHRLTGPPYEIRAGP